VDEKTRLEATVPELVKDYTRFILDHRRYYEGCTTENKIAILYANSAVLANPKGHYKYLALAQALAEAGYQYDVIYSGDDVFTPSEIAANQLSRYQVVLIAEAGELTESQREALRSYAQTSGRVIAYSPNEIGDGSAITTVTDNRLLDFWRDYQDRQRAIVVAPLDGLDEARVSSSDPSVNVVRYQKDGALICHVLDYDYREQDDTIVPKRGVEVSLPWVGSPPSSVRWLSLQGEQELPCSVTGGRLLFTIPAVDPYGLAIVGNQT